MDVDQLLAANFEGVEPELDIAPGDFVRSYDFGGVRDCYAEGVVEGITEPMEGCPRYKVRLTARVFSGEPVELKDDFVYPPLNGTPTLMGKVTNLVEKVQPAALH